MPPEDFAPPEQSSPWQNTAGVASHPESKIGAGGPGSFTVPRSHGREGNDSNPLPHPDSPHMRYEQLNGEEIKKLRDSGLVAEDAIPLQTEKKNDPPETKPGKTDMKRQNTTEDINYTLEILADKKDDTSLPDRAARTFLKHDQLTVAYPQFTTNAAPGTDAAKTKITGLVGKITVTGTVTIQVRYALLSGPKNYANWGRGTTPTDKSAGDVTAGFHESCHVADYSSYLKTKIFPTLKFNVKVGQTEADWNKACAACDADVEKFFADCEKESKDKTDEVGSPKMSETGKSH